MPAWTPISLRKDVDPLGRPVVSFEGQHGEAGRRRQCRIVDGGPAKDTLFFVFEIPRTRDWRWRVLAAVFGAAIGFVPMPALFENGLGMTPYAVRDTMWATVIPMLILASVASGALVGWHLSRGRGHWLAGAAPLASLAGFVVKDSLALSIDKATGPKGDVSRVVRADFRDGHTPIELLWTFAPSDELESLVASLTEAFVVSQPDASQSETPEQEDQSKSAPRETGTASPGARGDIPDRLA